jgi:hypothetical protein
MSQENPNHDTHESAPASTPEAVEPALSPEHVAHISAAEQQLLEAAKTTDANAINLARANLEQVKRTAKESTAPKPEPKKSGDAHGGHGHGEVKQKWWQKALGPAIYSSAAVIFIMGVAEKFTLTNVMAAFGVNIGGGGGGGHKSSGGGHGGGHGGGGHH